MGQSEDIHNRNLSFVHDLRHALNHLYEPEALRHSPLIQLFDLAQVDDVVMILRRLLVDAIEKLRPEEDVPLQSTVWRTYHVMVQRFIEQATQQEVANDLGLSVRQMRRQESAGLRELARVLLKQYHSPLNRSQVDVRPAPSQVDRRAASLPATSREQELAWSQRSYPHEFIAITGLVESILETLVPLARMMDVQVTCTLSREMPRLAIQPITVRQALLSLLALAIRRAPGGRVAVTTESVTTGIILEIAAHSGRRRMAPQLNEEDNLDLIQTLIASSGGHLELLPPAAPTHLLLARIALLSEQQFTVMVIDDNPDTLQLLERYVTDTRYNVVSVQESEKAVAVAEEIVPDVILLDVMMPSIDGWELMGRLRQHPKIGRIPLIICTILPQEQLALALGATAFLRKPIGRKEFLTLLANQLNLLRG
jgi:CheY-like chemotaxis protein